MRELLRLNRRMFCEDVPAAWFNENTRPLGATSVVPMAAPPTCRVDGKGEVSWIVWPETLML
jgi:hypothetical protein